MQYYEIFHAENSKHGLNSITKPLTPVVSWGHVFQRMTKALGNPANLNYSTGIIFLWKIFKIKWNLSFTIHINPYKAHFRIRFSLSPFVMSCNVFKRLVTRKLHICSWFPMQKYLKKMVESWVLLFFVSTELLSK